MYKQLTSEQRYTISVLLFQRKSLLSFIAGTIVVSVSTVCRERKRKSNVKSVCEGCLAVLRTRRCKAALSGNRSIGLYVCSRAFEHLRREQWSPEQVSGWLCKEEGLSVSKSTICNWIATIPPHYKEQHPQAS